MALCELGTGSSRVVTQRRGSTGPEPLGPDQPGRRTVPVPRPTALLRRARRYDAAPSSWPSGAGATAGRPGRGVAPVRRPGRIRPSHSSPSPARWRPGNRPRSRRTSWRRTRSWRAPPQRPRRGQTSSWSDPPPLRRAEERDGPGARALSWSCTKPARVEPLAWIPRRARCWVRWPGPAQRPLVNRVRVGRQQLSAGMAGCRSQPGRRTEHRAVVSERMGRLGRHGRRPLRLPLPALPAGPIRRDQGPGPRGAGAAQRRARRPGVARLPVQRAPGHRQDLVGAHPGQGAQLRGAGRR